MTELNIPKQEELPLEEPQLGESQLEGEVCNHEHTREDHIGGYIIYTCIVCGDVDFEYKKQRRDHSGTYVSNA